MQDNIFFPSNENLFISGFPCLQCVTFVAVFVAEIILTICLWCSVCLVFYLWMSFAKYYCFVIFQFYMFVMNVLIACYVPYCCYMEAFSVLDCSFDNLLPVSMTSVLLVGCRLMD